eukprot:9369099-Pyramimonas_sp.AAC.1
MGAEHEHHATARLPGSRLAGPVRVYKDLDARGELLQLEHQRAGPGLLEISAQALQAYHVRLAWRLHRLGQRRRC